MHEINKFVMVCFGTREGYLSSRKKKKRERVLCGWEWGNKQINIEGNRAKQLVKLKTITERKIGAYFPEVMLPLYPEATDVLRITESVQKTTNTILI